MVPFREKLTCTVNEAIGASGVGRTTLYRLIGEKRIRTIKIGTRTLIDVRSMMSALGFDEPTADKQPEAVIQPCKPQPTAVSRRGGNRPRGSKVHSAVEAA